MEEDEGAASRNLLLEVVQLVQDCILIPEYLGVIIYQDMGAEVVIRIDDEVNAVLLVREGDFLLYDIIVAFLVLLNYARPY